MVKDKDWNAALIGDEDWKATMGSEVFRNFAKATLAEEAKEERLKKEADANRPKEIKTMEDVIALVKEASPPNPIMQNLQYDGKTYQEHVAEITSSVDFSDVDLRTQEEKKADLERFEQLIKQANLEEAEKALGLDENMHYVAVSKLRNK